VNGKLKPEQKRFAPPILAPDRSVNGELAPRPDLRANGREY
jgi:hypothetical protein